MQDLFVIDPQGVVETIQGKNDKILRAAYDWILDTPEYHKFTNWSDPETCSRVLCLTGPAGTGKSMLTIGIISELSRQSSNIAPGLAYFFFQASQQHMTSPTDALRSLIWMLLIQQPHLISYVRETRRNAGAGYFDNPNIFWPLTKIFKEMLTDKDLSPVYLALDALDECNQKDPGILDLKRVISDSLSITSKVRNVASGSVLEVSVQSGSEPVNAYIKHKLLKLEQDYDYAQDILEDMSGEIRKRTQNTFLWVSLVFKDIIDNELPDYEAIDHVKASPPSLMRPYDRLMAKIESARVQDREYCGAILAASCFAYRPLSYAELHVMAGLPPHVRPELIVRKCGSFLAIRDGVAHVLHNSTREYLHGFFASSCKDGGVEQYHMDLSNRSIKAMSDILKANVYDPPPGVESKNITAPEEDPLASLQYSCEFWTSHLCAGGHPEGDNGYAMKFLKEHFPHWLESLSLIRRLPSAVASIRTLLQDTELKPAQNPQLINLVKDAERFVLRNLSIIEQAPLQTYGTALVLSPVKSQIRARHWNEKLACIADIKGVSDDWDPCLLALRASSQIKTVVFSADNKFLASASATHLESDKYSGQVHLWDTATGVLSQSLGTRKAGRGISIGFSQDSTVLASASGDIVQLWDVPTGNCIREFEVSCADANLVAFSPDTTHVFASGNSVQQWDVINEKPIWTFDEHAAQVGAIVFSADGKRLATAAHDGTVRVLDAADGSCKQILDKASDNTSTTLAFSPDGMTVASIYKTVSLWDLTSATCTQIIGADDLFIIAAIFSPDGKSLAVTSVTGKVHLFDIATGARGLTFSHGNFPSNVTFSGDAKFLASALFDGLVRLWDATSPGEQKPLGHDQAVTTLVFLSNGELATGSQDKSVKVWDSSRTCKHTLEGHIAWVDKIAVSPDCKILASGSWDGTVRVWSLETGACTWTLATRDSESSTQLPNDTRPTAIAFSPDGTLLIVGTGEGVVNVYNPITGACKQILKGQDRVVSAVSVSEDNSALITSSADRVQLWDLATGQRKEIVGSPSNGMTESSSSDNGQYLKLNERSFKPATGLLTEFPGPELSPSVIHIDGPWVLRGGEKLLQLPSDYKTISTAVWRNTLALGRSTGQLLFLEFTEN